MQSHLSAHRAPSQSRAFMSSAAPLPTPFFASSFWPVNLAAYPRITALPEPLLVEMRGLAQRTLNRAWYAATSPAYQAFVQPLFEALAVVRLESYLQRQAVLTFTRHMAASATPFWIWTPTEWAAVQRLFHKRWRYSVTSAAYLTCGVTDVRLLHRLGHREQFARLALAAHPTAAEVFEESLHHVLAVAREWGYAPNGLDMLRPTTVEALLLARSPSLRAITDDIVATLFEHPRAKHCRQAVALLSRILVADGLITIPRSSVLKKRRVPSPDTLPTEEPPGEALGARDVAPEWKQWCRRWYHRSTLSESVRREYYLHILRAGRWLRRTYPEVTDPTAWTLDVATAFVAAVDRLQVGDWSTALQSRHLATYGQPLSPRSKASYLAMMRAFFRDCQEWGWISRRFTPGRALRTPRSVRALIGPNPRVIDDTLWPKIVDAALHVDETDVPRSTTPFCVHYPLEMVRAVAAVWCGSALRMSDIQRLRVGCVRWQRENVHLPGSDEILPKDAVCFLDVPTNKTSTAYTKPISPLVGRRIAEWERVRPTQPAALDPKTGEMVDYLFFYRGHRFSRLYLNNSLIPLLCRKAGVPEQDARGPITSHRARSTLASLLFNAKHPLSLFQLQAFLGHRSLSSTQQYAQITPTTLAKAVVEAGVHETLTYAAKVLIDQDAILSGAVANGELWKYYDLGHGYCSSAFFTQCPHRMACVRCDWYVPKGSSKALYLESRANLARMKEEIPLTDTERAIVEGDLDQLERLCEKLADVPTLAGSTPRQLSNSRGRPLPILNNQTLQST